LITRDSNEMPEQSSVTRRAAEDASGTPLTETEVEVEVSRRYPDPGAAGVPAAGRPRQLSEPSAGEPDWDTDTSAPPQDRPPI
jgi:hypothetical protein